jgi:putative transposase
MSRPLRLEYAGALYHLSSRGNAQQNIFLDDADRRIFLRTLGETVTRFGWLLYSYCLMGNHYHLVAETQQANLSRGMHNLNGRYTQQFNRRHSRVGHLFQGRFAGILIERESHWLELARYVTLNPVRGGLAHLPQDWPWSSYRATAGLEHPPAWLAVVSLLANFGSDPTEAGRRYREFVLAGIGAASPWSNLRGQVFLGSDHFAERLRSAFAGRAISAEVPRAARLAPRPALDVLLPPLKLANPRERNAAIGEAHRLHGYTLAEIARHAGLHYSTVSRIAGTRMQQFKT